MRPLVGIPPKARRGRVLGILAVGALFALLVLHGRGHPIARGNEIGAQRFALVDRWDIPRPPRAPVDLALLPGSRLFVADGRRHAVLTYDATGRQDGLWHAPAVATSDGQVLIPVALAADADREIIHVLWQRTSADDPAAADGLFLDSRAPDGSARASVAWLGGIPSGVRDAAVHGPSGDVWVLADGRAHRVRWPARTVDLKMALAPADRNARRMAVTPGGDLHVLRDGQSTIARYRGDGKDAGPIATWTIPGGDPVAIAVDPAGRTHLLMTGGSDVDPRTDLVLVLDERGDTVERHAAAALQAPPVPSVRWPWAISATYDGMAFSTAGARLRVHTIPERGRPLDALVGDRLDGPWEPVGHPPAPSEAWMLATDPGGGIVLLDGPEERVLRIGEFGRRQIAGSAPGDAHDVTVGADGAVYVSSARGEVTRLAAGDGVTPTWSVACDCPLGARVAAGPGVVYAARPGRHAVTALDPGSGASLREISFAEGAGLWPSDIAVASGRLYTADLVDARIQGWTQPARPDVTWQAGLLSGPRRLTAGRAPDGTRVLAAAMADGTIELHDEEGGNLLARWTPQLLDGSPAQVTDLALDQDGLLYVADARRRAVLLYGAGAGIPPTVDPDPPATPTPSADSCTVRGDQRVEPDRLVAGPDAMARLTLSLRADCPASARVIGADIVLVLDRSRSMLGAPMSAARDAARAFAELLDVRHHRVGLVSFADDATMDVPPTDEILNVVEGLGRLQPEGQTNIAGAIERARETLEVHGRTDALPVIVLLTDGQHNASTLDPVLVALDARAWGAQIYTIGLGDDVDPDVLRRLAGGPDRTWLAPAPGELFPIYREILRVVLESLAGNFIIEERLASEVEYVPDSAEPPALIETGRLRWGRSVLPSTGISLTLDIRPLETGCFDVSQETTAEYTDADGIRRTYHFPVPRLCVTAPTPTPTVAPTATPGPVFLPVTLRRHCVPRKGAADMVLLIDTSASMSGAKLDAAKTAARSFLDQLDLRRDQAAVVGFSDSSRVAAPLTRDIRLLRSAVAALRTHRGTRIDLALSTATAVLRGPGRAPGNRPAIILLSDGAHGGPTGAVFAAAADARSIGTRIFTIGLGADADRPLLATIADPGRAWHAPTPADLAAIYREIAEVIPCP